MPSVLLTTRNVGRAALRSQRRMSSSSPEAPSQPSTTNRTRSASSAPARAWRAVAPARSEEHTSELQSLMRISYAVFCLQTHNYYTTHTPNTTQQNYANDII